MDGKIDRVLEAIRAIPAVNSAALVNFIDPRGLSAPAKLLRILEHETLTRPVEVSFISTHRYRSS